MCSGWRGIQASSPSLGFLEKIKTRKKKILIPKIKVIENSSSVPNTQGD
jgi:hypothetical protein